MMMMSEAPVAETEVEDNVSPPSEQEADTVALPSLPQEGVKDLKRDLQRLEQEKKAAKKEAMIARVKAAQERARQAQRKQLEQLRTYEAEEEILKELEGKTKKDNVPQPPSELEEELEETEEEADGFGLPEYLMPLPPPPTDIPPPLMDEPLPPPPPPPMEELQPQKMPSAPPMFQPPPPPVAEYFQPLAPPPPVQQQYYQSEAPPPPIAMVEEEELPPPSYHDFEQEEVNAMETDPRESQRVLEEQQLLLEQIAQEKADNDAAIAAAATEDLDTTEIPTEEKISEPPPTTTTTTTDTTNTIRIGNNTRVQLRGEEVTMKAIAEGEAMIVQCMACNNWMQIAKTARLMFCPVCSTVSRAEPRDDVTLEDARRAMAEKRREERQRKRERIRNMTWGQYVRSFFEDKEEEEGVATTEVEEREAPRTASVYGGETDTTESSRRPLISVQTGSEETTRELPAARVAEKRPFHSCVTNLTKTLAGGFGRKSDGSNYEEFMHIDGVDSTSLLSVTRAGRNVD